MMPDIFDRMHELGSSPEWLGVANFILCILLLLWMLRYRRAFLDAREDQRNNRELIENLPEGVYRSTLDGRQISANKALVALNGYSSEAELLSAVKDIGAEWYVEPGRRAEFQKILQRDGLVQDFVSEIYRHKTRERIWITESARLVRQRWSGRPIYYEGSVRDITETKRRLALEEQFQKLTQRLPVGLFQFVRRADETFHVLYLSETAPKISGLPWREQFENPSVFSDLVFDEDRAAYLESLGRSISTLDPWDSEFRIRTRDGVDKWIRINAAAEAANGEITWSGYIADISSRKQQEMEIEELAFYDPLTRLPNRRLFLRRMAQAIASCTAAGRRGALLFIDLDNFKTLNDTQGHDIGDGFLVQVAERLRGAVGASDVVARLGGDEFVIVLEDAGPDDARATLRAITTANRILASLREGFDLGEVHHVASASIGVIVFDGIERRSDEILKRADIAMYQAKSAGRNGVALFDPVTMDRESERYRTVSDLRVAFREKQLRLVFQPQVNDEGRIVGAEALVRWDHPTRGLVMPDQFVPVAEQFGLNDELTSCVFEHAFAVLAAWQRDSKTAHLRMAINVGVQSFSSPGFLPMVNRLIATECVDSSKLTFELTEHVMAKEPQKIAQRMAEVKELGIRLSLDDFGTGYSSLTHLKRLPVDEVKIDGGFVADIEGSDSDRSLVKTILAMARELGLTTVAEHVENIRQEAFLRAFGCDFFQGHLYSRAVGEETFIEMVNGAGVVVGDRRKSQALKSA